MEFILVLAFVGYLAAPKEDREDMAYWLLFFFFVAGLVAFSG